MSDTLTANKIVSLEVSALDTINYALQQNRVPLIRWIKIHNPTTEALTDVELTVASSPEVCLPYSKHYDLIPANCVFNAGSPELILNGEALASITEKTTGHLHIALRKDGTLLWEQALSFTALAFDEWHGSRIYPELLSAFVTPNHPQIPRITARAAVLLDKWTNDPSLDGYQTQDPNRVLSQAAAVYGALQEQNIVYAVPPASFEQTGQRVRLCDTVLQQKMGTCLDLSLLYTSCLEAMGLHPLLILKPGHIFAGVWLEELTFPESVQDDATQITKRMADGISQIAVVECTAFTAEKNISFDRACSAAKEHLLGGEIDLIIDVTRARLSGVSPLPQRTASGNGFVIQRPAVKSGDLTAAPQAVNTVTVETQPQVATKMLQWERKLLDLGLRNALINLRMYRSMVPVLTSSVDELENALYDGCDFTILPRPNDYHAGAGISFETLHDLQGNDEVIRSEFKNKRLRSALTEAELTKALKDLYRSSRSSLEENGANTLYLALGLLRWYETSRSTKARYAPIVLLPVELIRKSAAQGYVLRLRDEDAQMNITMLEKLKQDFGLTIGGLDPLPADEHGIDIRKVFTVLRKAVMNQSRWDVLESAYLGIFSFSQFVMWNDLRNRADDLARNKLVRSLMDGKLAWQAQDMTIGDHVSEDDVFLPMSADASQLFAIEAASQGESFVLHGPPGTGKSQTITVLIANALAQGKTVLFVAEKMAALEVVQKRLSKIGLGPFCLELHSNKSKKRNVLEQLRAATEVTKYQTAEEYASKATQIAAVRAELDRYADSLHSKMKCGKSLYQLVNLYETNADAPDIDPFTGDFIAKLTAADLDTQNTLAERLIAAGRAVGHPHGHPLRAVRRTDYSQQLRHQLPEALQQYTAALTELEAALNSFCEGFAEAVPADLENIDRLCSAAGDLMLWAQFPKAWQRAEEPMPLLCAIEDMARHYHNAKGTADELRSVWKPEFLSQDAAALIAEWDTVTAKWFIPRIFGQNAIIRRLLGMAKTQLAKNDLRDHLRKLLSYQQELSAADALFTLHHDALGALYNGETTDWTSVLDAAKKAKFSVEKLRSALYADHLRIALGQNTALQRPADALDRAWSRMEAAHDALYTLLNIQREANYSCFFAAQHALVTALQTHSDELKEWLAWNAIAAEAENAGLSNVTNAYRSGIDHDRLLSAYRKAVYMALIMDTIDSDKELSGFSGAVFNEKIQQFKRMDSELAQLTQQEIYCRLAAKVPNFAREAACSSELGILQKAIRSGGRGLSIRKLFDQIPNLLPRLSPCMLMSPISAAQYLDPNRTPFDLVVFDEASQLPTCKAVGVLARGEDAVIVGDPKQMPPTSFFATNTVDEENLEMEDLESILDDCLALSMPQTHLLWHYRSRHESLIAFSNAQFYENKLYTFPSVNDRASKVSLVSVDGVFQRGKQRHNRAEAEAIVAELKRRCHDEALKEQTVGVVTFNINQQNLIDDLLSEACRTDTELDEWAYNRPESVFIKNLENVQGDERDVILFSIGYGPDENGKVSMNFGPLNREGGWRRLNVAVTRARQEMVVFSTLRPDQIDLNRTSAQGVAALKAFLEYASTQKLPYDENSVRNEASQKDGIAQTICEFLAENGYETMQAVGHSAYRIDIGVLDPADPQRYKLGILLDGGSYGTAKTTRDREIAQIGVLHGLGWQIMRIWTMDWWDNPGQELDRILERLSIAEEVSPPPAAEPVPVNQAVLAAAIPIKEEASPIPAYIPAVLKESSLTAEEFMLPKYSAGIRRKIEAVIRAEAPISRSLLTKRILQSYGITRAGSRIQNHMDKLYEAMGLHGLNQGEQVFFWGKEQEPDEYFTYRPTRLDEDRRDAKDIPVQEAAAAITQIVQEQISLSQEDLIREAAKLLGYARVGTAISDLMNHGIRYALWKNRIAQAPNGNWTLPQ